MSGADPYSSLRNKHVVPIPTIVCFGWYKLFKWIDRKLERISSADANEIVNGKELDQLDPAKKNRLDGYLAACAGISGVILIAGYGLGITLFCYYERTGNPGSDRAFISFIVGFPILIAVSYAITRHIIMNKLSNKAARPDQ
jgi:hypothetical protein